MGRAQVLLVVLALLPQGCLALVTREDRAIVATADDRVGAVAEAVRQAGFTKTAGVLDGAKAATAVARKNVTGEPKPGDYEPLSEDAKAEILRELQGIGDDARIAELVSKGLTLEAALATREAEKRKFEAELQAKDEALKTQIEITESTHKKVDALAGQVKERWATGTVGLVTAGATGSAFLLALGLGIWRTRHAWAPAVACLVEALQHKKDAERDGVEEPIPALVKTVAEKYGVAKKVEQVYQQIKKTGTKIERRPEAV